MKYAQLFNRKHTPQSMPIPGSGQIQNEAGGYGWAIDRWAMLDRFLILGSEGGTYYVSPQKLTQQNAKNVLELIDENGVGVVHRIVETSRSGRAPKNDPAVFALALAASFGNDETRSAALAAMPEVCRTGTHLFQFAEACDGLRGWGRGLRKAIGRWYTAKAFEELEYQLMKYQQRDGWSNRDLLRLSHPKPPTEAHGALFKWACGAGEAPLEAAKIAAAQQLKGLQDGTKAAQIVREAGLPREALPTELLNKPEVWEALLESMPMTAMVRNLATMTRVGLLATGSEAARLVAERLADRARLRKARVHPMAVLLALRTYATGRGLRGSGTWKPVPKIVDALDAAFYTAFENVEPTGRRFLLGVDVSGSMSMGSVAGAPLTPAEAATAMAMVTMATEENVTPMAFASEFRHLALSKRQRLDDAVKMGQGMSFGATDCALPMVYAIRENLPVDVFVVYTDNETWYGKIHPCQALRDYRERMGIAAKLVVVGITATGFSIADPKDAGMMDVVGFDASVPTVISQFVTA